MTNNPEHERTMDTFLKKLMVTLTGAFFLALGSGIVTFIQMNSAQAEIQKDVAENTITVKSNEKSIIEVKSNQIYMSTEIKDVKVELNKNRDLLLEVLREVKK